MKGKLISAVIILCACVSVMAQEITIEKSDTKDDRTTIGLNAAFVAGVETGISLRAEFEKSNRGKFLINSQPGLLFRDGDYLMVDIGLGYGHPVKKSDSKAMYLNGILSYSYIGYPIGLPNDKYGPTALLEFEYRRAWNNFSLQIAPGYRQMFMFNGNNLDFISSIGVRLGLIYSFDL